MVTKRDYDALQVEAACSVMLELVHLLGEYHNDRDSHRRHFARWRQGLGYRADCRHHPISGDERDGDGDPT